MSDWGELYIKICGRLERKKSWSLNVKFQSVAPPMGLGWSQLQTLFICLSTILSKSLIFYTFAFLIRIDQFLKIQCMLVTTPMYNTHLIKHANQRYISFSCKLDAYFYTRMHKPVCISHSHYTYRSRFSHIYIQNTLENYWTCWLKCYTFA